MAQVTVHPSPTRAPFSRRWRPRAGARSLATDGFSATTSFIRRSIRKASRVPAPGCPFSPVPGTIRNVGATSPHTLARLPNYRPAYAQLPLNLYRQRSQPLPYAMKSVLRTLQVSSEDHPGGVHARLLREPFQGDPGALVAPDYLRAERRELSTSLAAHCEGAGADAPSLPA